MQGEQPQSGRLPNLESFGLKLAGLLINNPLISHLIHV